MNSVTPTRIPRLTPLLLFVLLFLAAWLPRLAQIDSFVTADERRWLQRSADFLLALEKGDYPATYQSGHPGVTVTWAGAAGIMSKLPDYPKEVMRPLDEDDFDKWILTNTNVPLLQLLVAGRLWIVLAISLVIALTFLPLRSLFGSTPAFVAILFVAWDPFYIGLSRQLHPDGLVATLSLFALVTFFAWLYDRQRPGYLISAGLATGLAVLTKSPALIAPFVMVILAVVEWLRARQNPARRRTLFLGLLQLGLYSAIAYVLFWPATWSGPHEVFMRMLSLAMDFSKQGHELPLYFWGHIVTDPGPLFYPVTLLMRITPATLLGLLCTLVAFWRGWFPLHTPKAKQALLALLLFAVVYLAIITLAEKKMDRYLLPAIPVLIVVAAMGWVALAAAIERAFPRRRWAGLASVATVAVALLLFHAIFSALNFPYYLTYYNPLLGGSRTASQVMMIGWGEGLEKAAQWINEQPAMARPRHKVVSWYGSGPLSYYLDPTIHVLPFYSGGEITEEYWFDADYAIIYVNQWQRQNPSQELMSFFLAQPPAYTVSFAGLDLVHVYALHDLPPPDSTHLHRISPARWDDKIELAGYYLEDTTIFPGAEVPVALFWRGVKPIDQDYDLNFQLLDASGKALWSSTRSPAGIETSDWPVDKLWRDSYTLEVPSDLPPGSYQLAATFHAPNGDLLPLVDKGQPEPSGKMVVETLNVAQPALIDDFNAQWQGVKLETIAHVPTVAAGSSIFVDTTATITTAAPLKLSLRLIDGNGGTITQDDQLLQPTLRYRLLIPDSTNPGLYTLAAVVYDPASLAPLAETEGGQSVSLSQIEVRATP